VTPAAAIARLVERRDLDEAEMAAVIDAALDGSATPAQLGAILVALRMKGETVAELTGAARALRARAVPVPDAPPGAIDTCGTGGDASGTFNVSTAAALVAAAAGASVAKHGNRAVSSRTGSADVLEALGVVVELPPAALGRCLRELGFAFLFAPALHPALRAVADVRRELGVRTCFNLLGPLANPAGVRRQVVGVSRRTLVEPIAKVLAALGCERAWVVHGPDGLDELGLAGPSLVADVAGTAITVRAVTPADAGLSPAPLDALRVADATASAAAVRAVLEGAPGPARDVVCFNAAAALVVAGLAGDVRAGAAAAAAAIDDGRAASLLERVGAFTRAEAAR